jgi:hypothetical protein
VVEKANAKNPITAINLTKMNLPAEIAKKMINGNYAFAYLVGLP